MRNLLSIVHRHLNKCTRLKKHSFIEQKLLESCHYSHFLFLVTEDSPSKHHTKLDQKIKSTASISYIHFSVICKYTSTKKTETRFGKEKGNKSETILIKKTWKFFLHLVAANETICNLWQLMKTCSRQKKTVWNKHRYSK